MAIIATCVVVKIEGGAKIGNCSFADHKLLKNVKIAKVSIQAYSTTLKRLQETTILIQVCG